VEKERRSRSGIKSLIWRIVGVFILAVITYVFTKSWVATSLVTVIHHGVFLIVFYIHERLWLLHKIKNFLLVSILKMITYETICGNIILGTITYMVTGELKQMTAITLTYIGIKHIIYIWNEFIWSKISWGQVNEKSDNL